MFLLPFYTASLFYLAKEYYGLKVARWIPIVAPMSPIFLSFIYGGFQANLFTLSLLLIALGLLAKPSPRRTAIASAIFAITLFTHSWTWLQYTAVLTLMLLAKIVKARGKVDRESLKPYLIVFAACIVSFTIRELVFMEKSFTLTATKFTCRNYSGFENLASIIDKLHFFFNIYTGGTLNYPIYLCLLLTRLHKCPDNFGYMVYTYSLSSNTFNERFSLQGSLKHTYTRVYSVIYGESGV